MTHLLVSLAKRYPKKTIEPVKGTRYDKIRSLWVDESEGLPIVVAKNDRFRHPQTKKFDIETGEDQKGQ